MTTAAKKLTTRRATPPKPKAKPESHNAVTVAYGSGLHAGMHLGRIEGAQLERRKQAQAAAILTAGVLVYSAVLIYLKRRHAL